MGFKKYRLILAGVITGYVLACATWYLDDLCVRRRVASAQVKTVDLVLKTIPTEGSCEVRSRSNLYKFVKGHEGWLLVQIEAQ